MEKMTYVKALEIAIKANLSEEVNEKLTALMNQLNKKASAERKPTKVQIANSGMEIVIFNAMEPDRPYTITDLIKTIPELNELSNQKVSALLRNLKSDNKVVREEVKGKAYFTKVAD